MDHDGSMMIKSYGSMKVPPVPRLKFRGNKVFIWRGLGHRGLEKNDLAARVQ